MSRLIMIFVIIALSHGTATAQDIQTEKKVRPDISSTKSIQNKTDIQTVTHRYQKTLNPENQTFAARSKDLTETATTVYKELLPFIISAVQQNKAN